MVPSTVFRTQPVRRSGPQYLAERILLAIFLGFVGFFVAFIVAIVAVQVWYAGRIFPGVSVGGVDVGGLPTQEAAARLRQSITYPTQGRILIAAPDQPPLEGKTAWLTTPAELGLALDAERSAQLAYTIGRSGGLLNSLTEQWSAWKEGRRLPPVLLYDQRLSQQFLTAAAKQIDRPIIEASLGLKGAEVTVRTGQVGRNVDIPATLTPLTAQLNTLQDGVVRLVIRETPPLIMDASEQASLARRILAAPLTLAMPPDQPDRKGPWSIDVPTLAAMLAVERVQDGQGARYQVTLNSQTLRTYLTQLAPSLQVEPQNARFIFNDKTKQLDVLQNSITGRSLDVEASLKAIQERILKGEHATTLAFAFKEPPASSKMSGEQLGIRELVRSESTYFYGSTAARVQNIKAAAARFHGLLVAPGETFSMSAALGDISLDNGYAEAMIILGNQTIKGVGGGVCQVSTTLFRTAFFAGYPIVQRTPHAYRVSYYEKVAGNKINASLAGLDATVFVPLVDFKFKNDTPYWLLMETYVYPSSSQIQWKFYSTSDNRRVTWDTTGPVNVVPAPEPLYKENKDLPQGEIKQVDWAADGSDVTVTRTVYRNNAIYLQDTIKTHYLPWQAIFEYGPGTELPTPTPKPE